MVPGFPLALPPSSSFSCERQGYQPLARRCGEDVANGRLEGGVERGLFMYREGKVGQSAAAGQDCGASAGQNGQGRWAGARVGPGG